MKYVLSLSIFLFLAACGSDSATNATDEVAMASEPAVESSASSVPAMVEYVWHSKEANFSDEALKEHTDRWAGIVDEAGMDLNYAAVITPDSIMKIMTSCGSWYGRRWRLEILHGRSGPSVMKRTGFLLPRAYLVTTETTHLDGRLIQCVSRRFRTRPIQA